MQPTGAASGGRRRREEEIVRGDQRLESMRLDDVQEYDDDDDEEGEYDGEEGPEQCEQNPGRAAGDRRNRSAATTRANDPPGPSCVFQSPPELGKMQTPAKRHAHTHQNTPRRDTDTELELRWNQHWNRPWKSPLESAHISTGIVYAGNRRRHLSAASWLALQPEMLITVAVMRPLAAQAKPSH